MATGETIRRDDTEDRSSKDPGAKAAILPTGNGGGSFRLQRGGLIRALGGGLTAENLAEPDGPDFFPLSSGACPLVSS